MLARMGGQEEKMGNDLIYDYNRVDCETVQLDARVNKCKFQLINKYDFKHFIEGKAKQSASK